MGSSHQRRSSEGPVARYTFTPPLAGLYSLVNVRRILDLVSATATGSPLDWSLHPHLLVRQTWGTFTQTQTEIRGRAMSRKSPSGALCWEGGRHRSPLPASLNRGNVEDELPSRANRTGTSETSIFIAENGFGCMDRWRLGLCRRPATTIGRFDREWLGLTQVRGIVANDRRGRPRASPTADFPFFFCQKRRRSH